MYRSMNLGLAVHNGGLGLADTTCRVFRWALFGTEIAYYLSSDEVIGH